MGSHCAHRPDLIPSKAELQTLLLGAREQLQGTALAAGAKGQRGKSHLEAYDMVY